MRGGVVIASTLLVLLLISAVLSGQSSTKVTSSAAAGSVKIGGSELLGQSRENFAALIKSLGYSSWKKTREIEVYEADAPDGNAISLSVEYDIFGRSKNVSGDAVELDIGGGKLAPGSTEATVQKLIGQPATRIARRGDVVLLYDRSHIALVLNARGFARFNISKTRIEKPELI